MESLCYTRHMTFLIQGICTLRIVGYTLICFPFLIVGMEPHFLISADSARRGHFTAVNLKVENTGVDKIVSY